MVSYSLDSRTMKVKEDQLELLLFLQSYSC